MNVPFVDLSRQYDPLREEILSELSGIMDRTEFIGGRAVKAFEQDLAAWLGEGQHVVGLGNATTGLEVALWVMGIGAGDEVITTVHTAIATGEAITRVGAKVVFCDIDPLTYQIDPAEVRRKVTSRTKAIIPVHLYGHPANLDEILAIAKEHDLRVVEDCSQAQGARYNGTRVGNFGDIAVFSFFPSKNLGGFGDGGAVASRNPEWIKKIRMYCNHGRTDKYWHEFEGINSRLDTMKAAILRIGLSNLDQWNAGRQRAAACYLEQLNGIKEVQLPHPAEGTEPVYHLFVIQVPDRDKLAEYLDGQGIKTGLHYPHSLNTLPAYAYLNQGEGHFPVAEKAVQHILSIPVFPTITDEETAYVCQKIKEFYA